MVIPDGTEPKLARCKAFTMSRPDGPRTKLRTIFKPQNHPEELFLEYLGSVELPFRSSGDAVQKDLVFGPSLIGLVRNASVTRL